MAQPEGENPLTTPASGTDTTKRRSTLRRLCKDPQAVVTSSVLLIIVLLGVLAPLLTSHGPNEASLDAIDADVSTPGYPLGGDQSGRDIFARLLGSINTSMVSALIGTTVALTIGVTGGLIGGYFGHRIRGFTEWVFNLVMTFPGLLLLIILMPVTKGDYRITMMIFGVLLSPGVYRIVRNQVLGVRNELFVDAARVSGLSSPRILRRHILAAVRGPVIIATAFLLGASIGVQAGLAFLGVGRSSVPSFGSMIAAGFESLYVEPLQIVWPSVMLGLITASLVLFGNAVRDTLGASRRRPRKIHPSAPARPEKPDPSDDAPPGLLEVRNLTIAYPSPSGEPREVVRGVTLSLQPGETLGVVGESGAGKTQIAFAALGVLPPGATITCGSITFDGRELLGRTERELRGIRGRSIAYVPQEPMSNLDPCTTVGAQLVEGVQASTPMARRAARERVLALLGRVGIPDPKRAFNSYPHQISGGMAQRVLIAGAVASRPRILIADEPTTALDVTIQADILDLLRDLQQELNMAVLLVTHNFGVVADLCDRVAVMRRGKIVEMGTALDILGEPQHEYTRMLLASILDGSTTRTDAPSADISARDSVAVQVGEAR